MTDNLRPMTAFASDGVTVIKFIPHSDMALAGDERDNISTIDRLKLEGWTFSAIARELGTTRASVIELSTHGKNK